MAYVAVDGDGTEAIYWDKPCRSKGGGRNEWDYLNNDRYIFLPKGSIAKLIGRELKWDDEPVELVETNQQDKGI